MQIGPATYPADERRCRECARLRSAAWNERNPEKCKAAFRAWYERNREKHNAATVAWQEANREKYNAAMRAWQKANREQYLAWRRAWRESNPERVAAIRHAWRARTCGAEGMFTADDWATIKDRQQGCCALCGFHRKLTVDHIVPLSRGGSNFASNIQGLCISCNVVKKDKLPHELKTNLTMPERLAS